MTREAFGRAVVQMQPSLYRVSYGILLNHTDCADAVQECILKAWAKQDTLRCEAFMQSWMIRILINECYNLMRKRRHLVDLDSLPEPEAPPGADPALHDAIAHLDDKLRLPVVLHYMEGYRVDEIAKMLCLPSGTVKSRLMRARARLKDMLDDQEGGISHAKK